MPPEPLTRTQPPRHGLELGLKLALIPGALALLIAVGVVAMATDVVSQASPVARGLASAAALLGAALVREWARARRRPPAMAWLLALGAGASILSVAAAVIGLVHRAAT